MILLHYIVCFATLFGLNQRVDALKLPSFRASVHKMGRNIKHLKTNTKVPKQLRSAIAHGGIIAGGVFMPRKSVYASTDTKNMKPPTEIVTQKERTSPRDVWSGQKKAKRHTDIVQSNTLKAPTMMPIAIDKSKLSGSFVSAFVIFFLCPFFPFYGLMQYIYILIYILSLYLFLSLHSIPPIIPGP